MEKIRKDEIARELQSVKSKIQGSTCLVCVSKTYPTSDIALAYQLGQRHFGENHVLELFEKSLELYQNCPEIQWHMIGHLQSNKIKKLFQVPNLRFIHSIDSLKLCRELIKHEGLLSEKVNLFFQVNTSAESEKSGFEDKTELKEAINLILQSKKLVCYGLMTMGKIRTESPLEDAKICFKKLIELKTGLVQELSISPLKLSMGMSSDFQIALELNTDFIRVGSLIFGKR